MSFEMYGYLLCFVSFSCSLRSFATATPQSLGSFAQTHTNASGASATNENQPFMMTSGISAVGDMCLVVATNQANPDHMVVNLMTCTATVAAGDGREIFSTQPNGQLLNTLGKQCVGLLDNNVEDGGRLVLMRSIPVDFRIYLFIKNDLGC